ncbi:unnamed protein product, partial [Didymodactylos carnosus]
TLDRTTGIVNITGKPINIGGSSIGGSTTATVYFNGYIDHLIITQRVKTACEILPDAKLTVYYPFENSIHDYGPNIITGTLSNGTGTSFITSGRVDTYALQLNMTDSYFRIPSLTSLGTSNQSFTIALWIKPTALSGTLIHLSSQSNGLGWCTPFIGFSSSRQLITNVVSSLNTVISVVGPQLQLTPFWTHIA